MSGFRVRVKFTETREVQDGSGTIFEEGKEYSLAVDSARHWFRRGVAVEVPAEASKRQTLSLKKPEPEKPAVEEPEPEPVAAEAPPKEPPKRRGRQKPNPVTSKDL